MSKLEQKRRIKNRLIERNIKGDSQMRETFNCIDAGTEYCPCHLAESGDCILCSQLRGKCFCNCTNWNGVCIYSDFCNNNKKAKEGRKTYSCEILEKKEFKDDLILLKVKTSRQGAFDLSNPGSYVFIKGKEEGYFNFPVSIMETSPEEEWIKVCFKVSGVKTKAVKNCEIGEKIKIRGPYFNGVFGIKEIKELKGEKVLILGRGVGIAPTIPVLKKFTKEENKVFFIKDLGEVEDYSIEDIEKYKPILEEVEIVKDGELTSEIKLKINKLLEEGISHIHIGGADIITYKIINFLDEINRGDITLSCCNNFKMACGEGVCGACTIRYEGNEVRRYCKYQTDPRTVFRGRWFI